MEDMGLLGVIELMGVVELRGWDYCEVSELLEVPSV
jgi:hypothetical protein